MGTIFIGLFLTVICSAKGPLKVCHDNPRYFCDQDGKVVYLTGAHTWSNFKDMGNTDPPGQFDFEEYLDFLQKYNHNFIRLWTWELTKYAYNENIIFAEPFPWLRTGPGTALDGKPKFDLKRFNEAYFDRLRERVISAGKRGIYVSIMLFEGHGLHSSLAPWCWDGHPFNVNNNINGIDGDPDKDGRGIEIHTLKIPEVTAIQEAYVRKVIDTVNDLDNVLYEISNESANYSTEWQYYMIDLIHDYERTKPKQHPVGMTFQYGPGDMRGTNKALFESPAEWISPSPDNGYRDDPPVADGSKVILNDTDHLWGIGGNQGWVWKSFCRGMNPLFMDPYFDPMKIQEQYDPTIVQRPVWESISLGKKAIDPKWDPIRRNLGYTLSYAKRMDMAHMKPTEDISSTKYCLANPGVEYLVYAPDGGEFSVDLSSAVGELLAEWFNPSKGEVVNKAKISGGKVITFKTPFDGDAVLYIGGKVNVSFDESDELIANPHMGWQTFHCFADDDRSLEGLPSSSAYFRFYWSQIEPVEGRIDFDKIDHLIARARNAGQKFAFRVMCAGTDDSYMHVPQWLKDIGCPGFEFQYAGAGPKHWVPDMDHPIFKKYHYRLIEELGRRYDGHPDIDLIDIGTVGLWGEWHMSETGVPMPSVETRLEIIDVYCRAFPRTPKVMLIGDEEGMKYAKQKGCGWRADCLGDMGGFSRHWNHMANFYPQQLERTGTTESWKLAPVAFESCWDMRRWKQKGWDIHYIFEYGLNFHMSYMNNKSAQIPEGSRHEVEYLLRKIGYRLVLREAEFNSSSKPGSWLPIRMSWENVGVAPPYWDYLLAFRVEDVESGAETITITDTSIKGWLPGKIEILESIKIEENLKPGQYSLYMAIVDPNTKIPSIKLAITERSENYWYRLGNINVLSETQEK